MSLSCALLATLLQQWARRYIRLTQRAQRTPEKRVQMHAFYANGVDKMHVPWAVEALPTILHLSLFLFFGGLAVFLFNTDEQVFTCVVCWIGLFLLVYGLTTLLPLIWHDSPYYTPLSKPAWYLFAGIPYLIVFLIIRVIVYTTSGPLPVEENRIANIHLRYYSRISSGMEKNAEKTAEKSELVSEINARILSWTIISSIEGDDDSQEKFFEAIPGLFHSNRVRDLQRDFPHKHFQTFWDALDAFISRTLSSETVKEEVKSHRVDICKAIVKIIPCPLGPGFFNSFRDEEPVSIRLARVQVIAKWCDHASKIISGTARIKAAAMLARIQNRDGRWIALAKYVSGISENDLRHDVAPAADNLLLGTLIKACRQDFEFGDFFFPKRLAEEFGEFKIHNATRWLQHEFCKLWNELVQDARNRAYVSRFARIPVLLEIRHLYIDLHQGTDAAPTAFSNSTHPNDDILWQVSSYPLCNIASHRPDSLLHPLPSGGRTVLRQVEQASIAGLYSPPDPTTPSEIGDSSQPPATTEPAFPVHTSSYPTDPSPPSVALPDTPLVALLPHTPQGSTQWDIVATGAASAANPLLPPSVAGFFIPASPPSSHVLPSTNTETLALPLDTTPSLSTGNARLPRLRARGLVNFGGKCFANAVLQLLVHSPPFWNLSRELKDLKRQRGAGGLVTGSSATPLADATVRFFDEFIFRAGTPSQPLEKFAGGKLREAEEVKMDQYAKDSFEPTYLYDAMKEKEHLKILLVRSCDQDAYFYY